VIRLAVRVQRGQAELVLAELIELAPDGVEERELGDGLIEYAVYGAPGELPSLPDLQAAAGAALVEVSTSETADDWDQRWKRFHRPVLIEAPVSPTRAIRRVPSVRIRPPWEPALGAGEDPLEEIVIDPGQAFGTGGHPSTRLCIELMLELACTSRERGALIDLGSGSGVLAIVASRLGFAPVLALDLERESVDAAKANALANDVALEIRRFDLRREVLPWLARGERPAREIALVANLLKPLLLELARELSSAPAQLIASGLLLEQADEVLDAFAQRLGMRERRRLHEGEWAAIWLQAR
jgi:ribosomal protein L11 methyltransferase